MADPRSGRKYAAFLQRMKALHRQQARPCCLCDEPIDYRRRWPDRWAWTLEHLQSIAVAPHRCYDPTNCDAAHFTCNASAGATEGNRKRFSRRRTAREAPHLPEYPPSSRSTRRWP